MPRLAQGRKGQPEHVRGAIVGGKSPAAREVTYRVDTPGDVVDEEDRGQGAGRPHGGVAPGAADPEGTRADALDGARFELELALRAEALGA